MKLLERLLYEPQHQEKKVTDKALTRSIVISVIGILFCLTCLFGLTWAWFSDSVIVSPNKITAANFDLNITVTEKDTENTVTVGDGGYYELDPTKQYTVSLAKQGTAKTGFCLLYVTTESTAEPATVYYTDSIPQIDDESKEETEPFVFTLSGVSKIKFTAMWGQCPEDQKDKVVQYNGTLSLGTPAKYAQEETESEEPEPDDEPDDGQPDETTPSSTTEKNESESTTGGETANIPETPQTEPSDTEKTEPTGTDESAEPTEP